MSLSILIAIIFTTGSLAATDIDSANNTLSQDLASTDENTINTSNDTQEVLSDEEQTSDNTSTSAIETIYSSDNDTISSNKTISTDSNQKTTTNTPVSITTTANNSITLKTVIKTSDGTYVDEGTVAFKINGNTVGYGEVSDGVATYVYNMPSNMKSPVYTITAVYGATSQYKSSTGTANLYLNNVTNTNIKVTSISSQVGKTVTLKATLTTTNGSYVKNGTVAFKINGITIGYSEVSNGGVKLTYTIPSTWTDSTYNITVVYGATGQYKSSTGTGKLYLTYEEPDLTVSDVTTSSGKTVTLKASVTDDNTSISNGTVAFKINGNTVGYSDVSSGSANINLSVPTSWTDSVYTITAVYGQNGKYLKTSSDATLTVKKNTTTTVGSTTSYAGKTITLKATVKDSNSKSVTSGKVVFKINDKTVGTATVSNGVATISYKIPSSWSDSSYKISASYAGNSYYTSSSDTSTLYLKNVTQTSTKVTSITSTNGKTITLKATIKESDGYAKTGTVVFKINGKTVGTATVSNGGAKLSYKIPSSWSDPVYNITAVYGENGEYKSSSGVGYLYLTNVTKTYITVKTISSSSGNTITLQATLKTKNGSYVKNGTVAFKINGKTVGTATVSNGGAKLNYTIPSSWSDSKYTITVVYGNNCQYKASSSNGTLYLTNSKYSQYLKSTKNCQVNSATIQNIANKFSNYTSTLSKAKAIFNYLNDYTSYSSYSNTRYGAVGTYNRGSGNCCDLTHLCVAVMRAAGIPARYAHATCTFTSGTTVGHVWAEVYVNGKWYKCDLSSSKNSFGNINNWYKSGSVTYYNSLPF